MLVVSRKKDEVVFIGEDIKIMVVDIDHKRNSVRIGIEAPRDIKILRDDSRSDYPRHMENKSGEVAPPDRDT